MEGENLFMSVDVSYNGGTSFLFPNRFENEARTMISELGPVLCHQLGDLVLVKYFSPEAARRTFDAIWDEKNHFYISSEEQYLNKLMEEYDSMQWLPDGDKNENTHT